ncbi:hypothetical protein E4U32_005144 [Claviceps aff. humidiphila group G2b]|nr:hypothetical protein E4U32_005144 [Claviceps aff. humidiphila group G2b]
MGLWPLSSSSSSSRSDAIRSGDAIPTRQERSVCWASRDAYYACLDANNIVDANKDPSATKRTCPRETDAFERDCAAAWVKYFKQWRVADIQKKRRLEALREQGAQEIQGSPAFSQGEAKGGKGAGKEEIQDMLDKMRR